MDRCINCGIKTSRCNTIGRRVLDDEMILAVIRKWREPQSVNSSDHVCQACWNLAQRSPLGEAGNLGHRSICLRCGRSLASRVSHLLHTGSPRELRIYNVIQEWIMPKTIEVTSRICHACWVTADRAAVHMVSGPHAKYALSRGVAETSPSNQYQIMVTRPSTSSHASRIEEMQPPVDLSDEVIQPPAQVIAADPPVEEVRRNLPEPTIVLPYYMRAIEKERRCFIEGCLRTERYRVPLSTRKMLLSQYKYYIPENNHLCDRHSVIETWDFLTSLRNNYVQTFTAKHIQDMMSLKEVDNSGLLHFEIIDDMEDHVVHTCIGKNKQNDNLNDFPQLTDNTLILISLGTYQIKQAKYFSNQRTVSLNNPTEHVHCVVCATIEEE